jgi:two-component system cell cycle sensor histidine kinase/response regulator CckA
MTAAAPPAPAFEARYRELFGDALVGIYVSRPEGGLIACNAAFARLLGFESVADAVGTRMDALYADAADRDRFVAHLREQGRLEHHRGRLRRRDGRVIDAIETVVGAFDADGALIELRGFLIDVSESAEAERALAQRERQFRSVFDDAADAMVILDDDRVILDANAAAATLFGGADQASGALAGRALDDLISDDPEALDIAWRELLALGEAKREHRVRSGLRAVRLVECSYRAHVRTGGHLCIARDITDRRAFEERLAQSEKIESVGRLAGGIAHDFNNLLTAILGYTELLLAGRGTADPVRSDLEEIQKAGRRAAGLTQQLLAFSRKQMLMPKDVDLNGTVDGLRTMLARLIRADIALACETSPTPAIVRIDPTQIERAILNLVLNARDALPAGGHITVDVARLRGADVTLPHDGPAHAGDYVRIRVSDDGVGIPVDAQAHLFEPFFTTKDVGKGTGLGLASVYGIVRQSNGFIGVDSAPGRGSVFTMYFPAVGAPAETAVEGAPPTARRGAAILLVEDEDAVRVITAAVLRRSGYRVFEAARPSAACEIFDRHAEDIDLLLTDVVMPEMNGPSLAQRLIGLRPSLRTLFISGYADVFRPLESSHNPNISLLAKPFQASALVDRVVQLIGTAQAADPPPVIPRSGDPRDFNLDLR